MHSGKTTEPKSLRFFACPFWALEEGACRAAAQPLKPTPVYQARYCRGDDHDNCAYFLSRALRSSRTHGLDRDPLTESGK